MFVGFSGVPEQYHCWEGEACAVKLMIKVLSLTGLELFVFGECVSFISALPNLEHVVIPGVDKSRYSCESAKQGLFLYYYEFLLLVLQP